MTTSTHEALLLDQELVLQLGTRQEQEPIPGQVLLRLEWAGVCGSDLHVLRTGDWVSDWPATLGHEVVGVVEKCPGGELEIGTRVVVDSRMPCGQCTGCAKAKNLCENMRWIGEGMPGGFQRRATFEVAQVIECPSSLEPALAVLAEPLAVSIHAVSRLGHVPDRVLILGYGPVGALVHTELSRINPSVQVTVSEPNSSRKLMAKAAGACVADFADGDTWPAVVDASGHASSLPEGLGHLESGGTLLLVGLAHQDVAISPQSLTERSLSVIGSNGFDDELPQAILHLSSTPDSYRWLVTDSITLDEAPARLSSLNERPVAGKLVIAL